MSEQLTSAKKLLQMLYGGNIILKKGEYRMVETEEIVECAICGKAIPLSQAMVNAKVGYVCEECIVRKE